MTLLVVVMAERYLVRLGQNTMQHNPCLLQSFLCCSNNKALTPDARQERNAATAGALQKRISQKTISAAAEDCFNLTLANRDKEKSKQNKTAIPQP
jgi:hypothetical protein